MDIWCLATDDVSPAPSQVAGSTKQLRFSVVDTAVAYQTIVKGRKGCVFTSLSTAKVISRRDINLEPGRNSLLFMNRRTIDSPPQRRTFIWRPGRYFGDSVETRTYKLTLGSQVLVTTRPRHISPKHSRGYRKNIHATLLTQRLCL